MVTGIASTRESRGRACDGDTNTRLIGDHGTCPTGRSSCIDTLLFFRAQFLNSIDTCTRRGRIFSSHIFKVGTGPRPVGGRGLPCRLQLGCSESTRPPQRGRVSNFVHRGTGGGTAGISLSQLVYIDRVALPRVIFLRAQAWRRWLALPLLVVFVLLLEKGHFENCSAADAVSNSVVFVLKSKSNFVASTTSTTESTHFSACFSFSFLYCSIPERFGFWFQSPMS